MLRSLTFGLDNEPGLMGTAEAGGVAGGKEVHFHSPEAKREFGGNLVRMVRNSESVGLGQPR